MENTEVIKALRCGGHNMLFTYCSKVDCPFCRFSYYEKLHKCNIQELGAKAADALEAANKRIVNLLTALYLANEKLAYVDCQPYTEIDGEEMIDDWVKTLVYEELHTQIPKESEWETTDNRWGCGKYRCPVCNNYEDEKRKYCPNCGTKMKFNDKQKTESKNTKSPLEYDYCGTPKRRYDIEARMKENRRKQNAKNDI